MKRLFDVVVSACALLVLALPLLVVIWMGKRVCSTCLCEKLRKMRD